MPVAILLLALAVAALRGGRPAWPPPLRAPWLAPLALGLQLAADWWLPRPLREPAVALSYGILLGFAAGNLHLSGMRILGLGLALNVLVGALNGGYVPVDPAAAARAGVKIAHIQAGESVKRAMMGPDSRLPLLGDVIPVPWPRPMLVSIGDLLIALGVVVMIQACMPARKRPTPQDVT